MVLRGLSLLFADNALSTVNLFTFVVWDHVLINAQAKFFFADVVCKSAQNVL